MAKKESTVNVRASLEEKALWKHHAPYGQLSRWIRRLIDAEIARQK